MRTILRFAAIAYLAYLALALLVISPALNVLPHRYIHDTYGWQLRTGWVLLNPFKLSLDISEAELTDTTGAPLVSLGEATANLSLESLWRPGWVLDSLSIQRVLISITRLTGEEYNFSSLLPAPAEESAAGDESGVLPRITIRDLDLHAESIALNDRARVKAYSSRWDGLHIRATDFSTVTTGGRPYTVDLGGDGGGTLHWEGEISLAEGNSEGRLTVSNLNLRKFWEFAEPWLAFELRKGRLDVAGTVHLDWNDAFRYRVSDGHVGLSGIDIAPGNPERLPDTALTLHTLGIDDIALDSASRGVTVAGLTIDGLAVAAWMEDSQVSLARMFVSGDASTQEPEPDTEKIGEGGGWSVTLGQAQISNGRLRWRSAFTDPAELDIQPIEASVSAIAWPFSGETSLALKLTVNEQASLEVGGALALADGTGTINYTLDGVPLAWFNPNLPAALKATIASGEAGVNGAVSLREFVPTTVALGGAIRDFALRMKAEGGGRTGIKAFRFDGLDVDMEQRHVALAKLTIDGFVGQLHIHKDGSINASNVWKEEVGERAEEIAEDLAGETPWSFSLPAIILTGSEVDFMDESLPIQFRTVIGDMEGEILNIDSQPGSIATVDIEGSVDKYAPVALKGTVSPFDTPLALDLTLAFNSVDMALLSPYSGTYAGYAIDRGLLDLDLEYTLQDNRLQGKNAIRIDKLKLGEKIDSNKAVDLPLELALAIMTDANGVIDMQVPVSGDVTRPDFELGSVITKAVLNAITKVITSPFTLLAGLASSEEDLQRLGFSSGHAELSEKNRAKLDALADALAQRPNLSLVITGRVNLEKDRERLQKNALKAELLEEGLSAEEIAAKGDDWEDAITERYEALPANNPEATVREQYVSVYQSIAIPDEALVELAQQRAVNTKGYLVTDAGLSPDRAVVGQSGLEKEGNTFGGVELGVEN